MPKNPKQIAFDDEARNATLRGVEKLASAVKSTLGPAGRSAVIDRGWGEPIVSKDGSAVADEVDLTDPYENMAARLVRQAAERTAKDAGDGSTTATILAESLYRQGIRQVAGGANPMVLARGIRVAVDEALAKLGKLSTSVKTNEQIRSVATVAANHDQAIGKTIAQAIERVGKDGIITVDEGKARESSVNVVEGMAFDRGYLSPHFITNPDKMLCELEDPYILVMEEKISSLPKILPVLEKVLNTKTPLLIIAEDIDGEVLSTLVVNSMKGVLKCAAVKAPAYGDRRKSMLEDIAILTGATAIMKDLGIEPEAMELSHLGRARKVQITSEDTTIIGGGGGRTGVEARAAEIRRELDDIESEYDREKLEERLAKLVGGVAVIEVGAATESDMKEKKSRFEAALSVTRAAQAEGVLPGGGVALFRAALSLAKLELDSDEEQVGVDVVRRALEAPIRQLCLNSDVEPATVVRVLRKERNQNLGYDFLVEDFVNMVDTGVTDATKVVRTALQNACSVALLLLTTDTMVAAIPKEEDEDEDHHHHHDDEMGGF
ncbi:MAG: chaperonin GroEL [Planctomycetota bacterium]|nr:chaperonin GroEL [Planctomycetota bacterium]